MQRDEPLRRELADFVARRRATRRAPLVDGEAGRGALELATRIAEKMESVVYRTTMFKDLNEFIAALDKERELARIAEPVSPDLEICAVTDRVSKSPGGGPGAAVRAARRASTCRSRSTCSAR